MQTVLLVVFSLCCAVWAAAGILHMLFVRDHYCRHLHPPKR
jgi:hypothetical protein